MPLLEAEMFLWEDISLNERSFCRASLEHNNKGILHILYISNLILYSRLRRRNNFGIKLKITVDLKDKIP
jgi:hypothetical protein